MISRIPDLLLILQYTPPRFQISRIRHSMLQTEVILLAVHVAQTRKLFRRESGIGSKIREFETPGRFC